LRTERCLPHRVAPQPLPAAKKRAQPNRNPNHYWERCESGFDHAVPVVRVKAGHGLDPILWGKRHPYPDQNKECADR
jgi:hypothetical protein